MVATFPRGVTLAEAESELRSAAVAFANVIPTGAGFFAARRRYDRAAVVYRDSKLREEMQDGCEEKQSGGR